MELEYRYALYGEIYQRSPWVHVVIDKRANALARLPVNVWDVNGDTRELDTRSQYAQLIANPCLEIEGAPYLDPFRFWHWIQTTIDIYGEAYLAIARDGNDVPIGFMPMHPSRVAIRRNAKDGSYDYYFQAGSGINTELVHFPQRDVVPFRLYNPGKLERGMSKMEAIRQTIFAEDSSRNAVSSMWKNGARPNLILQTPNRLTDVGAKRLKIAFDQAHAGSSNVGQTLVLEDGVEAKEFQISAVDLQLVECRKMNREEIAAVYDVAPTLIGILEHATFSNITEQMRGFYRDTMAPVIEFIQSVMDTYVGSFWSRKNIMRFATDEVMRGDFEMRMEAAHKGVSVAAITPNEARELLGYNRYDDPKADKLYCNSAIQELGTPGEVIRMNTEATGVTPDGIHLDPGPQTTPVPALAQGNSSKPGKPHSIPKKPPTPIPAGGQSGGPQPRNQNPSSTRPKHFREVNAQVGRGRTPEELKAFALDLAGKYPDELEDILESVRMAIAERDKKGKTT
ncbi:phage portal protein [Mycobacterium colombiense]|nr:phage portal protein [Mycobacterium colombiense]